MSWDKFISSLRSATDAEKERLAEIIAQQIYDKVLESGKRKVTDHIDFLLDANIFECDSIAITYEVKFSYDVWMMILRMIKESATKPQDYLT